MVCLSTLEENRRKSDMAMKKDSIVVNPSVLEQKLGEIFYKLSVKEIMAIIKKCDMVEPEIEPTVILNNSSKGMKELIKMIEAGEPHDWKRLRSCDPRAMRGGEANWRCSKCDQEITASYACLPVKGCKK
jgi:hypothetical protein